jgi:hypothetical protein
MGIVFCSNFNGLQEQDWDSHYIPSYTQQGVKAGGYSGLPGHSIYLYNDAFLLKTLPPATEYYIGMWFVTNYLGLTGSFNILMGLVGQTTALGYIGVNQTSKEVGWYNYATTSTITSGVTIPFHEVAHVEVRYLSHPTSGIVQMRKNGVDILNFSGNTGAGTPIYGLQLGSTSSNRPYYAVTGVTVSNSGWVGPLVCKNFAPKASGGVAELTPSAGSNFECVKDQPPTSSSVSGKITGRKDVYQKSDLTFPERFAAYRFLSVQAIATRGGMLVSKVKPLVRIGSTDYTIAGQVVPYSGNTGVQNVFETNPAGGSWTTASLSAAKIGVELET